ncbi:MAG: ABC transporter ATP-binding protein [Planctomycetota bacterium]|nr:MAG: ABC transporter ATP-binding protein [Planctomycetota bacterium]
MSPYSSDEVVATRVWDHSLFLRLLAFVKPHKKLFIQSFLILAALLALELTGPWVWRRALDGPIAASKAAGVVDTAPFVQSLLGWVAVYLVVIFIEIGFRYLEVAQIARTGQAVIHDLRRQLFLHMQRLDLTFFDKQPTGSLVTRVTSDVEYLNEMFTSGVVVLFFDMLKVVVIIGILFLLQWKLALTVTLTTPLLIGISIAFRGGARRAHRVVRSRLAALNGYLQEILSGIRVVQVFRREQRTSERFHEYLDGYFDANRRTIFLFALFYPSMSLAVYVIQGAALWIAVGLSLTGEVTFGLFLQFWFYLALLVRPIRELGERYNVLQSAFASAERIFQVLDTQPTVRSPETPRVIARGSGTPGHVRFEHVSFAYVEGKPVLEDVSFEIPPGTTVALVGATGAGKSTLVNLLLRFYDPTSGSISIDGVDIRELETGELRRRFGLVLQEDYLFAGTVRDNLVMDRPEVDADSLEEALETSRANVLIERLQGGLESEVAERGATFSTGERQLLAMARALAGRPDIIVLDEATASVDSATEARIEQATRSLLAGRSGLVVAHRLSTIRRANQILVMHKGRLRERGTHSELLAEGGLYARLYAMQFEVQDGAAEAV